MGAVVVAPLYVPKPAEETPWLGKPIGVAAVLLAALVPNFPLHQTKAVTPQADEILWVGKSAPTPMVMLQLPALTPFTVKPTRKFDVVPEPDWLGKPRYSQVLFQLPAIPPVTLNRSWRQFNYVPEPDWLGKPSVTSNVLFQLPAVPLFAKATRKFDHFVDTTWQDATPPVPLAINLPPSTTPPITNRRQFNYVEDIPGFKSIPFYVTVNPLLVLPFQNIRRFDNVPDPDWFARPVPLLLALRLTPQAVLPFANTPWKGPIPDPDWVGTPKPTPNVMLQLPATPIFGARGTTQFNVVPEPDWVGRPTPVPLLDIPGPPVLPFHNYPWQGPIPDPDWVGKASYSQTLYQLPAVPIFGARSTTQFNVVPEPDWVGKPQPVPVGYLPLQVVLPFRNIRLEDVVPEPNPSQPSRPIPQVLQQLPAVPIFGARTTRIFNVPDDQPWSQQGRLARTLYLPITILNPLETLKNVVVRVRSLHNTTQRVRFITNITSRRKP